MISKRLEASAKFIEGFHCLADCGTDHGYLPIFAVKNGLVERAIASDNKKFPLENARRNIESAYLEEQIELVLADGLPYLTEAVDVVTILGLGGRSITTIIDQANLEHVKRLVLSPNSEQDFLREYLELHHFKIIAEEFVKEKRKYYQILAVEKGLMELSPLEREFGPFIIRKQSPEFIEFVESLRKTLSKAIKNIKDISEKEKLIQRMKELKEVIT